MHSVLKIKIDLTDTDTVNELSLSTQFDALSSVQYLMTVVISVFSQKFRGVQLLLVCNGHGIEFI